ncbi:MAG: UDPGP type 1 family protein [Phycisphaerae bacterium]|nr:UDPGP type 1 family protein [Phycisphaerae bacterium]
MIDIDAITDRAEEQRRRFDAAGQGHLFRFWSELAPEHRIALLGQLEAIDLDEVRRLHEALPKRALAREGVAAEEACIDIANVAPASYVPHGFADTARYRAVGEDLLRSGKVAAFVVAGGQGTRLGWRGPKGTYPATVIAGKPLFRVFAEEILAAERKYGVTIPWYVMTSPLNDADTRAFFRDNNWFGLKDRDVFLFPQGTMPSIDAHGKLLLEEKHIVAVNPDGHGGALRALRASGAVEDMQARGIEQLSYFQVDNPLVRVVDPVFLGLHATHAESSGEMSSKMVAKRDAGEKVGVFCNVGGRTRVLEYSDLPAAIAEATDANRKLRFCAGSIAIHILSVAFIDRLTARHGSADDAFGLPFHRANKKVPHVDLTSGTKVDPKEPNAIKFEAFIFDALALCAESLVVETSRVEEFAPIKNATGDDSPASSHQLQSDRAGAWLESAGVTVPRRPDGHVDAKIEISPLTALEPSDLKKVALPKAIARGAEVVI